MDAKEEGGADEPKAGKEPIEIEEVELPKEELLLTANPLAVLLFEVSVIAAVVTYIVLTTTRKTPFDESIEPCLNLSCFQLENELSSSMNLSVEPCEDFYEYACGLWGAHHPGFEDQFHLLQAKVFSRLKHRLEEQKEKLASGSPSHATEKAAKGYLTCVDVYTKQTDTSSTIKELVFSKLEAGLADQTKIPKSPKEMLNILVQLSLQWNIQVLTEVAIAPYHNVAGQAAQRKRTVYVDYSVTVPLWKRHKEKFLTAEALAQCFRDFAGLLSSGEGKDTDVAKLVEFDVSVTTKWTAAASSPDRKPKYMQVKGIPSDTLDAKAWLSALNVHLPQTVQLTEDSEIYASDVGLFSATKDILSDHDLTLAYQLVRFHVARTLVPFTSYKLLRSVFGNPPNDSAPVELVTRECATAVNLLFPFAWATFVFGGNVTAKQQKAQEHYDALKVTTRSALTVFQSDYRAAAEARLDSLKPIIGWPKKFDDPAELGKLHAGDMDGKAAFINVYLKAVEVQINAHKLELDAISQSTPSETEGASSFRAFEATAMYSPWLGNLYVSPTILFDPFFVQSSAAFTWGAFGHVLAHELWHAAFGDFTLGFSAATDVVVSAVHTEKHACIAKAVADAGGDAKTAAFSAPEDVVDVTGLQTAYEAFNISSTSTTGGAKGAAGFTPEQLFYIGSCYKWCAQNGRASPLGSATSAKRFLRCNVPLMMVDGFSEAFSCAQDSPMVKFRAAKRLCTFSELKVLPNP